MAQVKEHKQQEGKKLFRVIALDGGAASGKSSTARALARELNLLHCDSGEHYRALTYWMLEAGIAAQADEVEAFLKTLQRSTHIEEQEAHIVLNGKLLSKEQLKSPNVNAAVSLYAALPCLRSWLLEYQRKHVVLAQEHGFEGLVMEGRDIGSVVLPDADYGFFLEADVATRQKRRNAQGEKDSVSSRDAKDSIRKSAPLLKSQRAITINTSTRSLEEVVTWIEAHIQE